MIVRLAWGYVIVQLSLYQTLILREVFQCVIRRRKCFSLSHFLPKMISGRWTLDRERSGPLAADLAADPGDVLACEFEARDAACIIRSPPNDNNF